MTVAELREFLADLPAEMQVITYEYEGQLYLAEATARLERIGPLKPGATYTATIIIETKGTEGVECVFIS
jgi:hypothetical protein